MDEREVFDDIDPVCDGFHVNPHLVIAPTASGEYEVSAPWTEFTARGDTERGAVHSFTQGWKERLRTVEAERAAVVAFMTSQGYVPRQRKDATPA